MKSRLRYIVPAQLLSKFNILFLSIITFMSPGLPHVSFADTSPELSYYVHSAPVISMGSYGSTLWCGTRFGLFRWDTDTMTYDIIRPPTLPHGDIIDMDVAFDGTLWIATTENGLARFDGTSWQSYSTGEGLPYMNGLSVHQADDGAVYAGVYKLDVYNTGGGLSRFDGESWTWKKYSSQWNATENFAYDIATDADGTVWVATGGMLASVVDTTWTFHDINAVRIQFDIDGTLWVHTGEEIYRMADGSFVPAPLPDGFSGENVVSLAVATDSGILIMTKNGSVLKSSEDGAVTILAAEDDTRLFTAMTVDESGTVWGGLDSGGIAKLGDGNWEVYMHESSPVGGPVYRISADNNGILWAIGDGGLFRMSDMSWEMMVPGDKTPDYGNDPDFSLFFDTDNRLWVVGYYNGVKNIAYLDSGDFVFDPVLDSIGHVFRAVPDRVNGLWLRFDNKESLFRYSGGVLSEIATPDDSFYPVAIDSEGGVWCTTWNRYQPLFSRYMNGVWEPHQEIFSPANGIEVTGMAFGPDGSAWVSVTRNMSSSHYPIYESYIWSKPVDAEQFTAALGVESGTVLNTVDKEGRLWISRYLFSDVAHTGTHYHGILLYDSGTQVEIREPDGLPDDRVRDIYADSSNRIWIATDNGILCYTDETTVTGIHSAVPSVFDVITAYPNPFNPSTSICFTLPQPGMTSVAVYSVTGQKVRTLESAQMAVGNHTLFWDGLDGAGDPVASGLYFLQVSGVDFLAVGKVTLIR